MADLKNLWTSLKLKLATYFHSLSLDANKAMHILAYSGVAFLAGFLFKRYFRTAFIIILVFAVTCFALTYFGFIAIDWVKIQSVTGVKSTDTVSSLSTVAGLWIKKNILVSLGALVGFIVGYFVG